MANGMKPVYGKLKTRSAKRGDTRVGEGKVGAQIILGQGLSSAPDMNAETAVSKAVLFPGSNS
jgi:hypothetical protein